MPGEALHAEPLRARCALPGQARDQVLPTRVVHLPLAFNERWTHEAIAKYMRSSRAHAPYLPSNVDFVAANNGACPLPPPRLSAGCLLNLCSPAVPFSCDIVRQCQWHAWPAQPGTTAGSMRVGACDDMGYRWTKYTMGTLRGSACEGPAAGLVQAWRAARKLWRRWCSRRRTWCWAWATSI